MCFCVKPACNQNFHWGKFDFAEAKDVVTSIKFCMDSKLERVFSLGGHAKTKRVSEDRSLHSGNVLPRPESLKRTIQGSIDLTNDSAEGLTELASKQLPDNVIISKTGAAPKARVSKVGSAAVVEKSPFEGELIPSAEEVEISTESV